MIDWFAERHSGKRSYIDRRNAPCVNYRQPYGVRMSILGKRTRLRNLQHEQLQFRRSPAKKIQVLPASRAATGEMVLTWCREW